MGADQKKKQLDLSLNFVECVAAAPERIVTIDELADPTLTDTVPFVRKIAINLRI